MNPIRAALAHRQVVMVLTMLAVLVGLEALFTMSRREDPKITIRTGLVVALYPGATAAQVEDQLARKVEQRLFRYAQVRKGKTYSTSRPGALIVNVELENDVTQPDEFWAMLRHDLNELRATELPSGVLGPIVDANFGDVVAVLLSVRGNGYGNRELSDVLDQIDGRLRTIDAVSKIRRVGERQEELLVTASSARLAQFGVSVGQVSQVLRARNAVVDAGAVDVDPSRIRVRATGLFDREEDLRRLLVGTAPSGAPAYLQDFARVERRYQDPQLLARVNGQETVLLAVEMHEGRNIVAFGKELRDSVDALRRELPQDVVIDMVADQPTMVEHRMLDFGKEFAIAVVAVIMVTVLLLPFRVAAIAAIAIPITVLVTIAVLNVVGVELHQISFAGLVVALGMVVDDAIVIADNYVEQLDHGTLPTDAAWRGATELAVPVLTATLTIVASFLPLAFLLPGSTGEFLKALPITVVVALLTSYVIAMFLTPVLCLAFIKTGLHAPSTPHQSTGTTTGIRTIVTRWIPKRLLAIRPLDAMQDAYERLMAVALPRKGRTLGVAAATLVAGVILLGRIPGQFFPFAERNQFVVDVWLREGSRIEATDSVMRVLERTLQATPDVQTVASFVGASAPRFYYNVNPEPPTPNYGQILVNTATAHEVPAMAEALRGSLAALAPEARVLVKELQQGPVLNAPVEVRLVGDDPRELRAYGDSVAAILEATPGSRYVHDDWREDAYGLSLELKRELASRLGFSDAGIAEQMAAGFEGVPVSTFWEGKRQIPIVFRLDQEERGRFEDVAGMYVASPLTGALNRPGFAGGSEL
jgi:multidrug efflux pump subunit AcrB